MKEYKYTIDGKEYKVTIGDIEENIADVNVNGESFKVEMEPEAEPEKKKPMLGATVSPSTTEDNTTSTTANVNTANAIKAPLPGVITEIKVAVGDEVGDMTDAEAGLGSQSVDQVSNGTPRQQRDRQQGRGAADATRHHDQHADDDDGEDRQNPRLAGGEGERGTRIVHEGQRQPLPDERALPLAVKDGPRPHL